ncbi:5,6-dimethylbenzimidazole synthase [Rhodobacteraceae bacterium NNCM2]|nr:5,6-dimethylbenzimidazole synthase [Coraliihabitans acroporae]
MHEFSPEFREQLDQLFRWRRDVRRFRPTPVARETVTRLITQAGEAPSVGLSEPWRFMLVESAGARQAALKNFEAANAAALDGYDGEKQQIYAGLKLSGMREAPVQIAVFCDEAGHKGHGLGTGTMPEMRRYSTVCAIMQLWLAARAEGLGLGWVSILDPDRLCRDLGAPPDWTLIAYLCLGHPVEDHTDPELERAGWETRQPPDIKTV